MEKGLNLDCPSELLVELTAFATQRERGRVRWPPLPIPRVSYFFFNSFPTERDSF